MRSRFYNGPANKFVAGFLGSPKMNFLAGRLAPSPTGTLAEVPGGRLALVPTRAAAMGETVAIGIRPEHIEVVAPDGADAVATVQFAEQLGGETFLHCDLGEGAERMIKRPGQQKFSDSELIGLAVRPSDIHCFDSTTGVALR